MSLVAAIRPDSVNLPLFLHVLGAMLLTGMLFAIAVAFIMSGRVEGDAAGVRRFALKTVLIGAFPAYLLMRVGAQWTESEENLPKVVEDSTWLGIGYIVADLGALLIIVSMVLSAIGLRRIRAGGEAGGGAAQARAVGIISILLLVAYVVAIWAMSAKPD